MTRRAPSAPSPRRASGDPYGVAGLAPFVAPILSLVGLAVVAALSYVLLTGVPAGLTSPNGGGNGPGGGNPAPGRTPSPSAPPVLNPAVSIAGSLVYVKAGNLWIQTGTTATQLTNTGRDSQPTWSADGQWVYFIETRQTSGRFPVTGIMQHYDLHYPILARIHPDGTGRTAILSGLYHRGQGGASTWFYFLLDPAVSPDGRRVAVASDGTDPTRTDVVLQFFDLKTRRLVNAQLPENAPLGQQDPTWSSDGRYVLYVKNARDGSRGAPAIWRYEPATKKNTAFTQAGYMQPVYSPNGRFVAAVRTTSLGTDVVVLDARNGSELARITNDGRSWGPSWSPDGSQIAFLRLSASGVTVDVQLATLTISGNGAIDVAKTDPLTEFSGLDGDSRPTWWGPALVPASPSPAASGSPVASASPTTP